MPYKICAGLQTLYKINIQIFIKMAFKATCAKKDKTDIYIPYPNIYNIINFFFF